ncbi:site-specific tyrosine recombinase XerD [Isoptericola sp. b441]|uniref:Tyrosine recombinase XerD n=1 Tax=Actinotalea lenta TaxID=3064654 RepID=A0ABT9DE74_9CELL|nr:MULTISPECIES: site-specific tyrosine recombinase XerD [unclassified Isoptericola]MDO8107683.1 site-specific tyrosine recombinase XerD [Isoptericola sp. b441]MDO8120657.1 site-specific tyrosine recombinase XerD [Isoptericola sp. b490]
MAGADGLTPAATAFLDHLAVERGLAAHTVAAYRRDLARYCAFLTEHGRDDLADVTAPDVRDYVLAVRTGSDGRPALAASSTARMVAAVRGWHRFAAVEGWTPGDPAASVKPPSRPRRLPKALRIEQVGALLDAAGQGDGPVPVRDRALLELLYSTGARISEVVGLDVDDLDLETCQVLLRGKGDKQRVVPVGSYAVDAVQAYLVRARPALASRGRGTPALFCNTLGRRLSRQSAWAVLRSAAGRAGLTVAVSPHTLRHSFATHLLAGGADVRVVQELLGHASVTTTQIYTQVTPETLREVYVAAHPRAIG